MSEYVNVKVGDRVKLRNSGEIVRVQEVHRSFEFTSFWSNELTNAWYEDNGVTKKNWHNANHVHITLLPPLTITHKKVIKHSFV